MYRTFFIFIYVSIRFLHADNTSVFNFDDFDSNISKYVDVDFRFTVLRRYFQLANIDFKYSFALAEFGYKAERFSLDAGFSLTEFIDNYTEVNNASLTLWDDAYKIKIGKFVTRVGVMDYLTSFEIFNPVRVTFYNDKNQNINRYAKEMLETNLYITHESKLTFYVQQYDDQINDYFYIGSYALFNNTIPFLLKNAGDGYLGNISKEILNPLYLDYVNFSTGFSPNRIYDMLSSEFKNSAFGMNYILNAEDYTIGAVWLNSYAKIPILKPTEELLDGLVDLYQEDGNNFIQNYFSRNNINNMLEFTRYNKSGLYFETTVDEFGLRGEFSYEDKNSIFTPLGSQFSIALGMDHIGLGMYNSIEVKTNHLSSLDYKIYEGIWVTEADPIDLGFVDLKMEHSFYYVYYDGYDYLFSKPSLGLQYKNIEFFLEYYYSSDHEIMENSFLWFLRMSF